VACSGGDEPPVPPRQCPDPGGAHNVENADRLHPLAVHGRTTGRAGPVPFENSFAFQVMLQPIRSWDLTTNRGLSPLPSTKPGDAFLFDLSENPRVNVESSFDMVRFYISQNSLDDLAYERDLRGSEGCGHRRRAPTIRFCTA
jgi:hypothetical protein